jgi:uncharacterized protein (DUF2236 family)
MKINATALGILMQDPPDLPDYDRAMFTHICQQMTTIANLRKALEYLAEVSQPGVLQSTIERLEEDELSESAKAIRDALQ